MKNGTCPECGSSKVYMGKGTASQGLRDEHTVHLAIDGLDSIYPDTYVCANCGYIRSFVPSEKLAQLEAGIGKSKLWKQIS